MKEINFKRVLFCKIQCPPICFCKPPATRLYASGPLKLENTPHVPSPPLAGSNASRKSSSGLKEEDANGNQEAKDVPKSCIRKLPNGPDAPYEVGKKRVQWMDNLGKRLAEIKEFESRVDHSFWH